ncbi:MAG TPA: haloacid dehalogenase type II [Candidatus Dormibacteraeota bacterium]
MRGSTAPSGETETSSGRSTVKALVFDIFGTVVDWRRGIARAAAAEGLPGPAFADAWRGRYVPDMDRVRRGDLPWLNLDQLQRRSLDELLPQFGGENLDARSRERLVLAWHRLPAWRDSAPGLRRLRRRYLLATLSNGGFRLLTELAKQARLPFDCILSAELCRHYKPDPEVYGKACELLGLAPSEVMMVAAHRNDLRAAQACGLRAAFVERPREFGSPDRADRLPDPEADVSARDLLDLADRLSIWEPAAR